MVYVTVVRDAEVGSMTKCLEWKNLSIHAQSPDLNLIGHLYEEVECTVEDTTSDLLTQHQGLSSLMLP